MERNSDQCEDSRGEVRHSIMRRRFNERTEKTIYVLWENWLNEFLQARA